MRDGVRPGAGVHLPEHDGRWPASLLRTGYGKRERMARVVARRWNGSVSLAISVGGTTSPLLTIVTTTLPRRGQSP
jgi:hypothetical protein